MIKNLLRLVTCASLTSACAHQNSNRRAPNNLPNDPSAAGAAADVGMTTVFRNAGVADVILLSDARADGERTPLCHLPAKTNRDQIPRFMQISPDADPPALGLRECDTDEARRIADLAANANRPQVAGVPVVAALCAIDFALVAGLTMALNNDRNQGGARAFEGKREYGAKAGMSAGVVASYAAKATTTIRRVNPGTVAEMQKLAMRASVLTAVCAGAGYAVGYWLVPLKGAP